MRRLVLTLGSFIVVALLTGNPALADSFSFTTLGVPGASGTFADGINDRGQVVGIFPDASGVHGFVDRRGVIMTINPPYGPLVGTYGRFGINDRGQTVGESSILDANGNVVGSTGFVDSGGVFTKIDGPNGAVIHPFGINNRDQIIGFYSTSIANFGFVEKNGVFQKIQDPNATGGASLPFAINNRGQIVGFFDEGATSHGFLYTNGVYTTIEDPLAPDATFATGINDRGQIVGYFFDAVGIHGFVDTGGVFTTIDDPNGPSSVGTFIWGINDRGQVVGTFGSDSFLATPVPAPEPDFIALLLTALVGFALFSRAKVESYARLTARFSCSSASIETSKSCNSQSSQLLSQI